MKKPLLVLTFALGLLATFWFAIWPALVDGPEVQGLLDSSEPLAGPAVTAAGSAETTRGVPGESAEGGDRQPVTEFTEARDVLLRGRCVDEEGRALPGCRVSVTSLSREDHPWKEPQAVRTGLDGRFELRFPPPPRSSVARVEASGRVPLLHRFQTSEFMGGTVLEAGTVLDVGDLVLRMGCFVQGLVKDTAGVPQPGMAVSIVAVRSLDRSDREFAPVFGVGGESEVSGFFRMETPIPPGEYRVMTRPFGRQREPVGLTVAEGQREAVVDLVLWAEMGIIEGLVVDEGGRPVEGAKVFCEPGGMAAASGPDGAFRLRRLENQPEGPVQLRVERAGFTTLLTAERYPWGSKSVTLALVPRRGFAVEVLAMEAGTGLPVQEFGVRHLLRAPKNGDFRGKLQSTNNPQGRILVENVQLGENVFVVEPRDKRLWPSDPVFVKVTELGAPPQRIEVPRAGRRSLFVVTRNGTPVVGTKVELLRAPPGFQVTTRTTPSPMPSWVTPPQGPKIYLLQGGLTDETGRLELRGPAGIELALRLLGPGHVPLVEKGTLLGAEGGELRVEVAGGATVEGVLLPSEIASRLFPPSGSLAAYKTAPERLRATMLPGLRLVRPSGQERWPAGGVPRVPFEVDGSFKLEDVPPGDWDVEIVCVPTGDSQFSSTVIAKLGSILDLSAGEVRRIELDCSVLLHAKLTGRVFLDGVPVASGSLQLLCRRPGLVVMGRDVDQASVTVRTDERGIFEARVPPGSYAVAVDIVSCSQPRRAVSEEWVQVGPGEAAAGDFHIVREK